MKEKPTNFKLLEEDFRQKRPMILFVGSGIDFSSDKSQYGDFSWNALLNHLLRHSIQMILPFDDEAEKLRDALLSNKDSLADANLQRQADELFSRMTKTTLVKQTLQNTSYVNLIQDFLYSKRNKKALMDACTDFLNSKNENEGNCAFYTLFSLAELILTHRNIKSVVTQNYDCFLEEAINLLLEKGREKGKKYYYNRKPRVVCDWKLGENFDEGSLNIYHVHGYIPRYEDIQAPKDNSIVLSLDEFYEDSRNVYSWQVASQLHFLSQYPCVFCGMSLDDYTSQRLLHYVKGRHKNNLYYITAPTDTQDDNLKRLNHIKNQFHTNNGLTVINDDEGFDNVYTLLRKIKYGKHSSNR